MAEVRVTLSANAGVSIQIGHHRIWVDVLHQEKQAGFSTVSNALFQKILNNDAFADPEYICVTHCHPDHYCAEMVEEARKRWPGARLCLPKPTKLKDGELTAEYLRLPHEGARYADVEHYGILISTCGKNILMPGDCETASSALSEAIGERRIDLAILNFPWVTLAKGRAFVQQRKPGHILLCHLPFEEDDVNGFRRSAQRNAQLLPQMEVRLLSEPLQTEIINI